jgi:glycosyltransferase involved in cell wall biosynthesis
MKQIFFVVPYPLHSSPSQRFRFEQYFGHLNDSGYKFRVSSFLTPANWRTFYQTGSSRMKVAALIGGTLRRLRDLMVISSYDFVFIHREAMPLGPPIFEWLVAKVCRKKIIYDFDDAIWLAEQPNEKLIKVAGKWRSKVGAICRWAYKVSCGNDYLCEFAASYNSRVISIPTIVDTENYHNPRLHARKTGRNGITIGWTGSHSTIKYLGLIEDVLKQLQTQHPEIHVVVIADRRPKFRTLSSFQFLEWNRATEIADLMNIDIGVMPLPDDSWARGKCGFKAIQYMALGIPTVASPVGVNTTIVNHGKNGFLAHERESWFSTIEQLIQDADLRKAIGEEGRATVINRYSVKSNLSVFLNLFE